MKINLNSLSNYSIFSFRSNIVDFLPLTTKKIVVIACLALSCLAAFCVFNRFYFQAKKDIKKDPGNLGLNSPNSPTLKSTEPELQKPKDSEKKEQESAQPTTKENELPLQRATQNQQAISNFYPYLGPTGWGERGHEIFLEIPRSMPFPFPLFRTNPMPLSRLSTLIRAPLFSDPIPTQHSIQLRLPLVPTKVTIKDPEDNIKNLTYTFMITAGVRKVLDKAFKGRYDLLRLPIYPDVTMGIDLPERTRMTHSVMKGKSSNGLPFIVIKVDCYPTDENLKNLHPSMLEYYKTHPLRESMITLYQTGSGPDQYSQGLLDNRWAQGETSVDEPLFFKSPFTNMSDGSLNPTFTDQFKSLQTLLETGEATDIKGWTWRIAK
jgi:hypothetical protein